MVSVQIAAKRRAARRYSDDLIDKIRELHEDHNLSYRQLARCFSIPKATIVSWLKYRRR